MTQTEEPQKWMQRIKKFRFRLWVSLATVWMIGSLILALVLGITTPAGLLEVVAIDTTSYICVVLAVGRVARKLSLSKADERELRAEDDILLQATAFSQTGLWIYLNIIPATTLVVTMKWFVPSAAILFFGTRAYAKLKDNNRWRYRSTFVLAIVLGTSLSMVVRAIAGVGYGMLLIENVDVATQLIAPAAAAMPLLLAVSLDKVIRKRYGQ